MKTILLFGAGKSAAVLIDYLLNEATQNDWRIIIADADKEQILLKTNHSPLAEAVQIDIINKTGRAALIQQADIVISLMPPALHCLVAEDCIAYNKNLLTASYADEQIKKWQPEIEKKGLLFICELGLDPGIDHMSAMQLIDSIKANGGIITSFKSHCGGLVAPESDDNPWHYKISWNPRNVVMAGKSGAVYKMNGQVIQEKYETLFDAERGISFPAIGFLSYYPNRNSLDYIDLYKLHGAATFMRTTLRYPDFIYGWKHIIDLKLTDENIQYNTNGLSLQNFFAVHFEALGFEKNTEPKLKELLVYLGMEDGETLINKGNASAIDILQFILEKKLALQPSDKDMIAMLHEIEYTKDEKEYYTKSSLVIIGENNVKTAMAKTVGLPLGITAKLILNGTIRLHGLYIPVVKEIYEPVLTELKKHGVSFTETGKSLK